MTDALGNSIPATLSVLNSTILDRIKATLQSETPSSVTAGKALPGFIFSLSIRETAGRPRSVHPTPPPCEPRHTTILFGAEDAEGGYHEEEQDAYRILVDG